MFRHVSELVRGCFPCTLGETKSEQDPHIIEEEMSYRQFIKDNVITYKPYVNYKTEPLAIIRAEKNKHIK